MGHPLAQSIEPRILEAEVRGSKPAPGGGVESHSSIPIRRALHCTSPPPPPYMGEIYVKTK